MRWSRPGSFAASVIVVIAGIGVALVPTLYTAYPEWTHVHHTRRLVVIILWALCVGIVGVAAARRDFFVETTAAAVRVSVGRKIGDRREEAYYSIVEALLRPVAHGLSPAFAFKVFRPLLKSGQTYLAPLNKIDHEPWERWEVGHGAVGLIWEEAEADRYIMLDTAGKLNDPRLGLSARQQEEYGSLTLVAACSMHDERGNTVAVLAVSSVDPAASDTFRAQNGPLVHRKLADDVGVLIADLILTDPPSMTV